jgi:N-methylhydantoinase A
MKGPAFFVGTDIGGTFSDTVVVSTDGRLVVGKARTTADMTTGFARSLESTLPRLGLSRLVELLESTSLLVHGTTVATNVVVQRTGARVGLLTTRGHADVLQMMLGHGYNRDLSPEEVLHIQALDKPLPLVPHHLIAEIDERVDVMGDEIVRLQEEQVRQAAEYFRDQGVEAVAISYLWSFKNGSHETRTREIIKEILPNIPISMGHSLAPRMGEYERTVAAVLDAYLAPACQSYLGEIEAELARNNFRGDLEICQTTGGMVPADVARKQPLYMVGSGPAAGIIGAMFTARERRLNDVIATDMGGTSFDVGIIHRGSPVRANVQSIDRFSYFVPSVEVKSVGSGGGSIVWADSGRLRVGPESAGSNPGPVAYGQGGNRPTITDCALVLGYLPEVILNGRLKLNSKAAYEAVQEVGSRLGLSATEVAAGAFRVVNSAMAELIRQLTTTRGLDPRDFVIVAYGGAGPLHVGAYGRELGVKAAIVPHGEASSVWSAFGAAISDISRVFERTVAVASPFDPKSVCSVRDAIRQSIGVAFRDVKGGEPAMEWSLQMRHKGQPKQTEVPVAEEMLTSGSLMLDAFTERYQQMYGRGTTLTGSTVLLDTVQCVVSVSTSARQSAANALAHGGSPTQDPRHGSQVRKVYWEGLGFVETPIIRGLQWPDGTRLEGPAVVESDFTTILVHPGQVGEIDALGNLVLLLNDHGSGEVA